jgi:hypothetical protein
MAMGPRRDRGSRKHVLDLLECGEFRARMDRLFTGTTVRLAEPPHPRPVSRRNEADWAEYDAETYLKRHSVKDWAGSFSSCWWVAGRGTRPTWDLLCHVFVSEKPGLLLAEAKAHEGELDWAGKRLSPSAKRASKENHAQIAGCIREANNALNKVCDGVFNLDVGSHYQLANRVAYGWKLASLGLPVVLLYLGFTGDTYFADDYIRDDAHWQRVMGGYLQGVVSQQLPERPVVVQGGGSLLLVIRSLPVSEPSRRSETNGRAPEPQQGDESPLTA